MVGASLFETEHFSGHHFLSTIELARQGSGTEIKWQQTFDTAEHNERIAACVAVANEQNLARLAAEVARGEVAT